MIDKINENIKAINDNIEVLPKKTKKNIEKYVEYLDDSLKKYNFLLEKDLEEINYRRQLVENKYLNADNYETLDTSIDYDSIKLSDDRARSSEKLNLDYLFYCLENSSSNLDEVNKVIKDIITNFAKAGVELSEADFDLNKYVNTYIKSILANKDNIQDIFNDIYWKETNILKQVELNVRHLYYKNESKLKEFYKNKFLDFNFRSFIHEHKNKIMALEQRKHDNQKYNFDLFYNKEFDVNEYLNENKKSDLFQGIFVNLDDSRNYENVVRLRKSLYEYKEYKIFEHIIKDFKELYEHKAEYKDIYPNKLKDVSKKEKTILSLNKKINCTGLFKPSPAKIITLESEKSKIINELIEDYKEVDELKIKDTIFNYVNEETTYYDMFKLTTYNFNYFVSLMKKENPDITIEGIKAKLDELQKYIYDNYVDIIDNIKITENKDIEKIICDKYKLNGIIVNDDNLSLENIDSYISSIDRAILYYDVSRLNLDLEGIKFLLDSNDIVKKID